MIYSDEQRACIEHPIDESLLVTAGPGTGKTAVLAGRILFLLEQGVPPDAILAFAFTRSAAANLRARVLELTGDDRGVEVTTFHAWALRRLRVAHYVADDVRIATDEELERITTGIFEGGTKRPEANKVGRVRFRELVRKRASRGYWDNPNEAEAMLLEVYYRRLFEAHRSTYDDVLPHVAQRWDECVGSHSYRHVLVDEAHDMTPVENGIVCRIGVPATLVLDPRQAIYAWRGANVDEVLATWGYDSERNRSLSTTYRFGKAIADEATAAARMVCGMDVVPGAGPAHVFHEEYEIAIDSLGDYVPLGSCVVLCRTNRDVARVVRDLGALAHPVTRRDPPALRAAIALARLVCDATDDESVRALYRLAGAPFSLVTALEARAGQARPLLDELRYGEDGNDHVGDRIVEALEDLHEGSGFVLCAVRATSLLPHGEHQLEDGGVGELDLPDALDALAMRTDADAWDAVPNGKIPVATVHAAKGREWDVVHVVTSSSWPPEEYSGGQAEEWRTWFVAVTRARRELVIVDGQEVNP